MALHVVTRKDESDMAQKWYTTKERVYVDADGNYVKPNDKRKARLYAAAGRKIPYAEAERLGLVKPEPKGDTKRQGKGADKQRKPAEDKQQQAEEDKG